LRSSFTIEVADIMGQMFSHICPFSISMLRARYLVLLLIFVTVAGAFGQTARQIPAGEEASSAQRAIKLAQTGHCEEAVPALKRTSQRISDKAVKRTAAFAGVRCAMLVNQVDAAVDFLRFLNHEFPNDPEVLSLSVHTYSDLSTRAAQRLAMTAPNSAEARKLNAEALEAQGKWEAAEKEYRFVLQQNPQMPGIHFLLGRLLLSKPDPGPTVADDAKKEFQAELEIDPANAGAEYVLGELARQESQWPDAVKHFTRASKLDAGFGDAFLGLGVSLISAKRFSEAIPPLETAVKLEPKNPAAHYNLAQAYNRAGRKQDADKEFAVHRQMTEQGGTKTDSPQASPPENSN
jgi:tetratricopeptide (TPR) repeat protein